jgi:hypothetical protein
MKNYTELNEHPLTDTTRIHLEKCIENLNKVTKIQEGDFILLPDGQTAMVTHVHDYGNNENDWKIQTSKGGDLHLSESGYTSYSGGLDSGTFLRHLERTTEKRNRLVWVWKGGLSGAHRGVYVYVPFPVWKLKDNAPLDGFYSIYQQ